VKDNDAAVLFAILLAFILMALIAGIVYGYHNA
jgi:cbb3-type cytochrome oxidase subunit 3